MRLGLDLVLLDEFDRLVERGWFRRYFFAEAELAQADGLALARRREYLAGRFAAKEAVLKVLGVGLFERVLPRHIEVERGAGGEPRVRLSGSAAAVAAQTGIGQITVSITHKRELVAAVAAGW